MDLQLNLLTSEDKDQDNKELNDTLAPTITSITGDLMGDAGTTITITTTFLDDVAVTSAKLYYKPATALAWSSKSILTGSAILSLPAESNESWYYYVTVDDAAGNGPLVILHQMGVPIIRSRSWIRR